MKIGIPKGLLFQYYYPLWRSLFENLGFEVVLSDKSSKTLVQKGIAVTVPEICLPIKIFNGHVINLIEKDVDYIFCPRYVHIEKGYWFCPKYIGIPELVEKTIPEAKLLVAEIDCKREDTADIKCYLPIAKKLGISTHRMKQALKAAQADFAKFRGFCQQGLTLDEASMVLFDKIPMENFKLPEYKTTIGLLGYVYNVYDPFISMEIIKKLRELKVRVITFDMLTEAELHKYRSTNTRPIFWTFADKLYQAAHVMIADKKVDGLIHITAFGCGPDSVVGKEIEHDFADSGVPFMTLRIDEHTGESHLQTRIEAFTDMIKRKIYRLDKERA
ncbi:MAG: acyl-CoA dehydratase activase-related protein [Clostridia bacterium]|nr:acyl-CoA dehydratase activase-related protein [Clostridia bacterium]